MTQTTMSPNGHTTPNSPRATVTTEAPVPSERRQSAGSPAVSPEDLVQRHVDDARRQLAEARERLKAARRRVVQLEDAVCNWERFAAELREGHQDGRSGR
jgi:hypothetical protein